MAGSPAPFQIVTPPASSETTSSSSITTTSRVSRRKAGIAEATNCSPSPTPITSGHSRRAATSRPGSSAWIATKAKWPARSGRTERTAAARSPSYRSAIRCGSTSVSVSLRKTEPRSCSPAFSAR